MTNAVNDIIDLIRSLVKDRAKSNGQNVFEYVGSNAFTLSELRPDADSIKAYVNGEVLLTTSGSLAEVDYDPDTNQVSVIYNNSGDVLTLNDIVTITYNYYKKYSDEEIRKYLISSLAYFAQHNYSKTLIYNEDNDTIDVISGEDELTVKVSYFVALIAAISIDPQNIAINTPDFKLTANRTISDQEQIAKAFAQFKRFVGSV